MRRALAVGALLGAVGCGRIGFGAYAAGDGALGDDGAAAGPTARVSAGRESTCALRLDGSVWCWGDDDAGQLADGMFAPRALPVQVSGLPSPAVALEAGFNSVCVLLADQSLWCWGNNGNGQLGLADDQDRARPTRIPMAQPILALTAGAFHTCAILADHTAWCWGADGRGQVGDGTASAAPVAPVQVLTDVAQISAGDGHTCAVKLDHTVLCWGDNDSGELGVGGTAERDVPTVVGSLVATAVFAGAGTTCALDADGHYSCWGRGDNGQLGVGSYAGSDAPAPYSQGGGFVELALGDRHTCGRRTDGSLACWGADEVRQLGLGEINAPDPTQPVAIAAGGPVVSVTAGEVHTCIARADGSIACWGSSSNGQLGDGVMGAFQAVAVPLPAGATDLAVSGAHACAVVNGVPYCWGQGTEGEVGDGTTVDHASPTAVPLTAVDRVTAGSLHACASSQIGGTHCWGDNSRGQLGAASSVASSATPVGVQLGEVGSLSGGRLATCAVTGGAVIAPSAAAPSTTMCWGAGGAGQLGDGQVVDANAPTLVTNGSGQGVAAGGDHACLRQGSVVVCWGANDQGQLGDNGTANSSVPVTVDTSAVTSAVLQLGLGDRHSCLLDGTGTLYCWGNNGEGELGVGDYSPRGKPVGVPGLASVSAFAAGVTSTCAAAGIAVECWGGNDTGQLGTGDSTWHAAPTPVLGLPGETPVQLAVGERFACVRLGGGRIFCWGDNARGQLGIGTLGRRATPHDVVFP